MKKTNYFALFIASMLLFQSCATLLSGSYQKVNFQTKKDGVVYQNLKEIGKANADISIKRSDLNKLYTVKHPGCPDKQLELPIKINGAYLVNIPFAFVGIGIITAFMDISNGNQFKTNSTIPVEMDCIE